MSEEVTQTETAQVETQVQQVSETPTVETPVVEAKVEEVVQANPEVPTEKKPEVEAKIVPEKYDLKLPEGSLLDAKAIETISSYAKEKGLSNDEAQALINRDSSLVAEYKQSQESAFKQVAETWVSQVQEDKEIGGASFKENAELAKRVIKKFATDDFSKVLDNTGLGNHPELVRVFVRIGKQMGEDKFVNATHVGAEKKSIADRVYGGNG